MLIMQLRLVTSWFFLCLGQVTGFLKKALSTIKDKICVVIHYTGGMVYVLMDGKSPQKLVNVLTFSSLKTKVLEKD